MWIVRSEYDEREMTVSADDALEASDAAEVAVRRWEAADAEYPCLDGGSIEVSVQEHGEDAVEHFTVTGASVPEYYADRN